jgi:hypothetical protein
MSKTLKQLAQEAISVQNASNLCGVAQSFAKAMLDLANHTKGTDERNKHPVAILWSDKIAHLTGTQDVGNDVVMRAYDKCHAWASADDPNDPYTKEVLEVLASNGE